MSDAATIVIVIFITLVLGNFVLQFYVAYHLYGSGFMFHALRGTRVFIRGWTEAKARNIQDLMVLWSIILAAMILMLCPVAYYGSQNQSDTDNSGASQGANNGFQTRAPTATRPFQGNSVEFTSPAAGAVLSKSAQDYVPVDVSVDYDNRQVEYWQLIISPIGGNERSNFGDRHFMPEREANPELDALPVINFEPGVYWITVQFINRDGSRQLYADGAEWHEIVIAE